MRSNPVALFVIPRLGALLLLLASAWFARRLQRTLEAHDIRPWARHLAVGAVAALALPLALTAVLGLEGLAIGRSLPESLIIFLQVWHILLVAGSLAAGVTSLAGSLARRFRPPAAAAAPVDAGRRSLLAGPLFLIPPALAVYATGHVQASREDFDIRTVRLPRPEGLGDGGPVRLVQLSDLHLGSFFGPERLEFFLSRVYGLEPDAVLLTGDLVNNDNRFLAETLPQWRTLAQRVPVLACLGNHDYIDDVEEFSALLGRAGVELLRNRRTEVVLRGVPLQVGGTEYAFRQGQTAEFLRRTYDGFAPRGVSILLAHNPITFDAVADQPVDLTASGHTHGGQIVLTREERSPSIADPFIPYTRGLYRRGNQSLYVNVGLGSWFALRINCAPEITIYQL